MQACHAEGERYGTPLTACREGYSIRGGWPYILFFSTQLCNSRTSESWITAYKRVLWSLSSTLMKSRRVLNSLSTTRYPLKNPLFFYLFLFLFICCFPDIKQKDALYQMKDKRIVFKDNFPAYFSPVCHQFLVFSFPCLLFLSVSNLPLLR